ADGDHVVALSCGTPAVLQTFTRIHVDTTHLPTRIRAPGMTVAANQTRTIEGDTTVEVGATLTLSPGSHLVIGSGDKLHTTTAHIGGGTRLGSGTKTELIVSGALVVGSPTPGGNGNAVIEPQAAGGGAGSWGSIITDVDAVTT